MTGRIVKGIAGFYYVQSAEGLFACRAKGIFRKDGVKPLVGDNVLFDVVSYDDREGNVTEVLPEKNRLVRPEVANVDQIFLIFSGSVPAPNYEMLNRYLVTVHDYGVPVCLVVNKTDLCTPEVTEEIRKNYEGAPYPMFFVSVRTGEGTEALEEALKGKVTVLAGPSGVGKSSLVNHLFREERMETGSLSERIARGKNTTRHAELFALGDDTFICDTPGFTAVDVKDIEPENLILYFDELVPYSLRCRYSNCAHMKEKDCAVKQAVRDGLVSRSRYLAYRSVHTLLEDAKKH